VIGIAFTVAGAYHLGLSVLPIESANKNGGLVAIWMLLFGFGATSIATLIAGRVRFLSRPLVRKLFTYPFFAAAVLCVGYLAVGALSAFVGLGKDLWAL
jgi:hypothetical protein